MSYRVRFMAMIAVLIFCQSWGWVSPAAGDVIDKVLVPWVVTLERVGQQIPQVEPGKEFDYILTIENRDDIFPLEILNVDFLFPEGLDLEDIIQGPQSVLDAGESYTEQIQVMVSKTALHGAELTTTVTVASGSSEQSAADTQTVWAECPAFDSSIDDDWVIDRHCTFSQQAWVSGHVKVLGEKVLTLTPEAVLAIDFHQKGLHVESLSGVLVIAGAKIRQKYDTESIPELSIQATP